MGSNHSVSARHGAFTTPLVTPSLLAMLTRLPTRWKDCGALARQVVARLSARVAQGPSAVSSSAVLRAHCLRTAWPGTMQIFTSAQADEGETGLIARSQSTIFWSAAAPAAASDIV